MPTRLSPPQFYCINTRIGQFNTNKKNSYEVEIKKRGNPRIRGDFSCLKTAQKINIPSAFFVNSSSIRFAFSPFLMNSSVRSMIFILILLNLSCFCISRCKAVAELNKNYDKCSDTKLF